MPEISINNIMLISLRNQYLGGRYMSVEDTVIAKEYSAGKFDFHPLPIAADFDIVPRAWQAYPI